MTFKSSEYWDGVYQAMDDIELVGGEILDVDITFHDMLWPVRAPLSLLVRPYGQAAYWVRFHLGNYKRWFQANAETGWYVSAME